MARDRERLEEVVERLPESPAGPHLALAADVSKRGQVQRAIDRFAKRAEGLDLAVANAGIAHYGPFVDTEIERAEEMVRINLLGTIYTAGAALPHMLDRARGHLVILSSGAGIRAFPWAAVYGATKAADRGFAEALRHELSGTGVSVTTVFPGEVETDLHAHERALLPDWRENENELPPQQVADAIVDAVEEDRRAVYAPGLVRLLGLNGLAPRLTDRLLARIRGRNRRAAARLISSGPMPARLLAASAAMLALSSCGSDSPAGDDGAKGTVRGPSSDSPNIVVVMSDDQDVASLGQAMPRTKRLARTGTTFTDFVVTSPTCCPSRAAFITGEYGHNNGVLANVPGYPDLREKENVLPAWLAHAGYRTAEFGKFMNGYESFDTGMGALRGPGWDHWEALLRPYSYFDYDLSINNVRRHFGVRDRDYLDDVLTRRALRFIAANRAARRPFFVWLNLYAPHLVAAGVEARAGGCRDSAVPAPGDENRFRVGTVPTPRSFGERDVSDKPFFVRARRPVDAGEAAKLKRSLACRLSSLVDVDRSVARIHDALRKTGQLDNTVLVFTSDNGWLDGQHRLRGKAVPYEEAVRVPLVVWAPRGVLGGEPAPTRVNQATANIDLAPTLLRIASATPCRNPDRCRVMDGRSLLPLLRGRANAWPPDRAILIESEEGDFGICRFQAVRTARNVYAEYSRFARGDSGDCARPGARELYDLNADPAELRNLLPARPGSRAARTRAALVARLDRLRDCQGLAGRDPPRRGVPSAGRRAYRRSARVEITAS